MSAPATNRWRVSRLKFDAVLNARIGWHGLSTDDHRDVGDFLVTGTDFSDRSVNWDGCKRVDRQVFDRDPNIQLANGDLLVTKDGTIGKVAVVSGLGADQRATLNSGVFRVRVETNSLVPEFLYYLLRSALFDQFVDLAGGGSTIEHLYQRDFVNFKYPLPPLSTQKAIADYLDTETARIDALIEKKKRLVELLGERRRPSIQAAVDSITPQSIVPLRHLLREVDIRGETDREVLSVYRDIGVVPKASRDDNFNKTPENLDNYKSVEVGNVVMNKMKAWQGSVAVSEHSGIVSGDYLVCRWTGPWVLPNYVHHVLRSPRMIEEYRIRSSGIRPSQWRLYWEDFAQIQFPLCTPADQQRLVEDLDNLTASDNHLIERLNSQVALLLEKRQALITAAVTGELEIPRVAA